ncbi:Uma2 family endonuclease [Gemmata sp.]|uniref:Uma2 family endonuclease n=1 Tax=Gemmata sp. TaxID=1914242 RepID=UPI003F70BD3E
MAAARVTKPPKPKAVALAPAIPPLPVRRFTVEEYHKLGEIGVLTENDRVELIHGWIVPKMTIHPPHNYAVTALMQQLGTLGAKGVIRVQQPITTADSEPEPDVVLATGSNAAYKTRNPKPTEVVILVEVADSSLNEDQTTKHALYAGAKVAVYWIVNLVDRRVEVYTQPKGGKNPTYRQQTNYGPDDTVPVVVGGNELGRISVKELLP